MGHSEKLNVSLFNPVWQTICAEAETVMAQQREMTSVIYSSILTHENLQSVLSYRLAQKLSTADMSEAVLNKIILNAYETDSTLVENAYYDIIAVKDRDPACHRFLQPLLYYKGFLALQAYRVENYLIANSHCDLSYFLQMRSSEVFGVDIHPKATIGKGIMIDHAHSIVIGETAIVGDNVSMLHSVTLGGTGKDKGDRHPKIGDGVLLGAGASVLGNITVGRCSKIASGSVVLTNVPEFKTVAGVPAQVVGDSGCDQPSSLMDQNIK
ncbi:MAG: serine O-acetyltransferase [Paracoccaceae bacterium]|nr:serine O-acetyltransferase [Paracoccaceae bacterium]